MTVTAIEEISSVDIPWSCVISLVGETDVSVRERRGMGTDRRVRASSVRLRGETAIYI